MSSYIAFELDALNKAPAVARAAGVDEDSVIAGLVRLWAYVFREANAVVPELALRGFFGADIAPALEAFRFLEPHQGGWRVRGADKYLRVKKARQQAAIDTNAKRAVTVRSTDAEPSARPHGPPHGERTVSVRSSDALTPSTEHRAPLTTLSVGGVALTPSAIVDRLNEQRQNAGKSPLPQTLLPSAKFTAHVRDAQLRCPGGDLTPYFEAHARWLADPYVRENGAPPRLWLEQWASAMDRESDVPREPRRPPIDLTRGVAPVSDWGVPA